MKHLNYKAALLRVTCLILLAKTPVLAQGPLVLFDDFNAEFLQPEKWFGVASGTGQRESVREIRSGGLRLVNRTYSDTDRDSGTTVANTEVQFLHPEAITAIRAVLRVRKVETTDCNPNPTGTGARVEIGGQFFNTGEGIPPGPGIPFHDIFASIRIERLATALDPPDVLRVQAIVLREIPVFTLFGNIDLGSVQLRQVVRLLIRWDPNNDRFLFKRDNDPTVGIAYTVPDDTPPHVQRKALFMQNFVENCTVTPRPVAFMEAFVDNVWVNASAVP